MSRVQDRSSNGKELEIRVERDERSPGLQLTIHGLPRRRSPKRPSASGPEPTDRKPDTQARTTPPSEVWRRRVVDDAFAVMRRGSHRIKRLVQSSSTRFAQTEKLKNVLRAIGRIRLPRWQLRRDRREDTSPGSAPDASR